MVRRSSLSFNQADSIWVSSSTSSTTRRAISSAHAILHVPRAYPRADTFALPDSLRHHSL